MESKPEADPQSEGVEARAHVDVRIAVGNTAGSNAGASCERERHVLREAAEVGVAVLDPELDVAEINPLHARTPGNAGACIAPAQSPATSIACRNKYIQSGDKSSDAEGRRIVSERAAHLAKGQPARGVDHARRIERKAKTCAHGTVPALA